MNISLPVFYYYLRITMYKIKLNILHGLFVVFFLLGLYHLIWFFFSDQRHVKSNSIIITNTERSNKHWTDFRTSNLVLRRIASGSFSFNLLMRNWEIKNLRTYLKRTWLFAQISLFLCHRFIWCFGNIYFFFRQPISFIFIFLCIIIIIIKHP